MLLLAAVSLCALAGLGAVDGFLAILAVSLLAAMATTGLMPLAETIAMSGVRRAGHDYGRMRLWGSLSFIVAGFLAGAAISASGASAVWFLLVAGAVATLLAAIALPGDPDAAASERRPFDLAGLRKLATDPGFLLFLLAAGAIQSSHAVFYTFGVIEWQRQGIGPAWAAALWAIGVAAEIALFAWSGAIVARLGAVRLLMLGAAAGVLRWLVMAEDFGLVVTVLMQAIHCVSFATLHLGTMHYIYRTVPAGLRNSAQGLYAAFSGGIVMSSAMWFSGFLYSELLGKTYLVMAAISLVALSLALALKRIHHDARSQ
jgi:PPP family 3-phenylpropionic acid transporter